MKRLIFIVAMLCGVARATPVVVQDFLSGTNGGDQSGAAYSFKLPNATLPNNVLVCRFMYSSVTATLSIADDKGNTWGTPLVKITDATSGYTVGVWAIAPATGTRKISPTISAVQFNYNVHCQELAFASLTLNQSWGTNNSGITGPSIAAGSKTGTSGDILIQYVVNGDGGNGLGFVNLTTSIVKGTGFTLLAPNRELGIGAQYQVLGSTGAINPTMTFNQVTHDAFDTVAIELAPSASGTLPTGQYIATEGVVTIPNSVTSPRTEQIPCATGDIVVFLGTTDPATFDLYHGHTDGTTDWSDSDGNTFTGYLVAGHTAQVGQIISAMSAGGGTATCTNPDTRTVSMAFTDGGSPDPIHWYVLRGSATSSTRDTLSSAAAIGTGAGNSAACSGGVCYAIANQGAKSATGCPNTSTSNTGIQVTPAGSAGMIFAAGYTGSGPTCDVVGSSSGVVNDATYFTGETDAGSGLLDSASIYDRAVYSSATQVTIQDNWSNNAAAAASGAGYITVAFKAAPAASGCKSTRTLMGAGC